MKYIVLLCDGMSDLPCPALGGETPMMVAHKPNMDALAAVSEVGLAATVPETLPPGSDVANLSVMGYDPARYYTGRSPFEAASLGIELGENDLAVRCNLVRLSEGAEFADAVMESYCADDIHTPQAAEVIAKVAAELGGGDFEFYPGNSYRHCLVWRNCPVKSFPLNLTPPHDISGRAIGEYVRADDGNRELLGLMERSYRLLRGEQANCIWLWGEGKRAQLPPFKREFGVDGAVISAVDLLQGIGKTAEMSVLKVPGATGYIDTNFEGKAQAAVDFLRGGGDLAYIHVEAPDECGHRGEVENKVRAIELIDELVLGNILREIRKPDGERLRLLIAPDHPTPLSLRTHTREPVPFLLYDSAVNMPGVLRFDEESAKSTGLFVEKGHELMRKLVK